MARPRSVHRCTSCGNTTARWVGKCPACDEWNTLVEETVRDTSHGNSLRLFEGSWGDSPPGGQAAASRLCEVDLDEAEPRPTGIFELDRVLGGGLVPGSVTLVGGEPGIGKSTLLLQVMRSMARSGDPVLMVSAEESPQQVRLRAERLGTLSSSMLIVAGTDLSRIPSVVEQTNPAVVVVDSVQAVTVAGVESPPGSPSQVRAAADLLVAMAKGGRVPVVLVGHITKDGLLAGPKALEHLVDTVLTVEGDRHHAVRMLRASKHRFGPTGELGLFEMRQSGMTAVLDPYKFLLGDRRPGIPGSVVIPSMEGQRSLLVELQALVCQGAPGSISRRSAQGLDSGRLAQLLAVMHRRVGVIHPGLDVFVSAVGGLKVIEPAADLALALALVSASKGVPCPPDLVVFGEVGLGGELRQVPNVLQRLAEAARVGFRRAVVPAFTPDAPDGLHLLRAGSVVEALELVFATQRPAIEA